MHTRHTLICRSCRRRTRSASGRLQCIPSRSLPCTAAHTHTSLAMQSHTETKSASHGHTDTISADSPAAREDRCVTSPRRLPQARDCGACAHGRSTQTMCSRPRWHCCTSHGRVTITDHSITSAASGTGVQAERSARSRKSRHRDAVCRCLWPAGRLQSCTDRTDSLATREA